MAGADIEAVDPFHRFVLLAVLECQRDDGPVHSFDVTDVCEDLLAADDALASMVPGGVTRQRVISALDGLESAGLLELETKRSPTGKGRPAYSLADDRNAVLDALASTERFAAAVDRRRS